MNCSEIKPLGSYRKQAPNFNGKVPACLKKTVPQIQEYKKVYDFKHQKPVQWAMKRVVDYAGALVGIVATSPIMLLTAVAVKLDSKGPVMFFQERIGENGRKFIVYKFRSMTQKACGEACRKLKNAKDSRVTRVGKIIRRHSIDELPQLFNVLKGDMSLIGPRPITKAEVKEMIKIDKESIVRLTVPAGATLDYKGNKSPNPRLRMRLEKAYLDNWSFDKDLRLIANTLKRMIGGKNY